MRRIVRDKSSLYKSKFPTYRMTYDPPHRRGSGPELLLAKKQAKNRTPNFHFFDLTRGYVGGEDKLSKKSGCYLGKLRANAKHTENVLFGAQSDKVELATIVFMRPPLASQLKEGVHPRRMAVVLPPPPRRTARRRTTRGTRSSTCSPSPTG